MELGSATAKGREVEKLYRPFFDRIKDKWSCDTVDFGHTSTSPVDGFIVKDGLIRAVFEFKLRRASYLGSVVEHPNAALYKSITYDTIIISKRKVDTGQKLSGMFKVPFILIYAFSENDKVGYVPVTDRKGNLITEYTVKESYMPGTINGYSVKEKNCYIPVTKIRII